MSLDTFQSRLVSIVRKATNCCSLRQRSSWQR